MSDLEQDFFAADDLEARAEPYEELDAQIRYGGRNERRLWVGIGGMVVVLVTAVAVFGPKPGDEPPPAQAPTVAAVEAPKPLPAPMPAAEAPPAPAPPAPAPPAVAIAAAAPEPPPPEPAALPSPRLQRMLQTFAEDPDARVPGAVVPATAARQALEAGDFERALTLADALPPGFEADTIRGRAWFELGDDDRALEALTRARSARPDDAETLLLLGSLLQARDREAARDTFQAFLQHHPEDAHAHEVRAILTRM